MHRDVVVLPDGTSVTKAAVQRVYQPIKGVFEDGQTFTLTLTSAGGAPAGGGVILT